MKNRFSSVAISAVACAGMAATIMSAVVSKPRPEPLTPAAHIQSKPDPLRVALLPLAGDSPLDRQIASVQNRIRGSTNAAPLIEKLGWLYVAQARTAYDAGYYKLAEQCALALGERDPRSAPALLLRGHVMQSMHRFKEAEILARDLTARRGLSFDYGLLGDVLMEQGRLAEAVAAYQSMADLKPDPQCFTRIAHLRWLKGDLEGAIEIMGQAVAAASPRDPESAAWMNSRMAAYQSQANDPGSARQFANAALEFQTNYPPALLTLGKLALNEGRAEEAVELLRVAESKAPLPEYQWALADALREAGDLSRAGEIERKLKRTGEANDPRTFALFLATRGEQPGTAARLAAAELENRADILTRDAAAWASAMAGDMATAERQIRLALAEGTRDARLFLHAGIIAAKGSKTTIAAAFFEKACALRRTLLPSERARLIEATTPTQNARPRAALLSEPTLSRQPAKS